MINTNTMQKNNKQAVAPKKPNENIGLNFSTHLKIFDPNTKQVLLQKRGDN
jgi:hypothetical protein